MFGFSGPVEEDDDTNDSSSCPTYKHFNPSMKQRSKLGRRRNVPNKDEKAQETGTGNKGKFELQNQWPHKDDSGISISETTPSSTYPTARKGTLFNNQPKLDGNNLVSGFTPSFKLESENKFALPITPMRSFKAEPLKELNGLNNVINKSHNSSESSTLTSESNKEGSANNLQKQLNSSFICDESMPLVNSNDSQQNSNEASKTPYETTFSDDSSFMTAHDIHRPEIQTNKTIYDPEFFKTPGKNLAEIRIDESPFNPLEGFLEESDDFGNGKPRTPNPNNCHGNQNMSVQKSTCTIPVETPKACVKSLNPGSHASDHSQSDQMAYPLENNVTPVPEYQIKSESDPSESCHIKNNPIQFKDNGFKHPGYLLGPPQKFTYKAELNLNSSDVGNMRLVEEKDSGEIALGSCNNDDTTNVTYPQHSRGHHSQKNSFTSQFSLNPPPRLKLSGFQDGAKGLSLSSAIGRPLSAASRATNRGVISSCVDASANPFDNPSNVSAAVSNAKVGTIMNHQPNNDQVVDVRSSCGVGNGKYPGKQAAISVPSESRIRPNNNGPENHASDLLDNSLTWIPCVKPVKSQSSHKVHEPVVFEDHQDEDTRKSNSEISEEPTVIAKSQIRPPQRQPDPPVATSSKVNSMSETPQQSNPVQIPLDTPQSGQSLLSGLIKPMPQNVIKIKGTPYTILSLLGRGGSSQVYQALGPQSSKLMAIKCVNLATVEEAMATDYLNEIALLSKLQGCPSVIKMIEHEYVEQSQMLYVVLEKGDIDFSKLIKNISETKQMSMAMITYYWTEMLSAVHEIHKRGIIHSDLKPANFLLVEGRLKLIDFGIASSLQSDDTTSVMKEVPAGTYNYMSPEAISGQKINRKSDVWSMGCILYNLLYGRTPFSHINNRWQKLHAIADHNQKVSFPKLQHHTPPSLRLALRWCLMKDTPSRPTVEELVKLSELTPHVDSSLGKEIDGMMCKYFRKVLPNLKVLSEEEEFV